MTEQDFKARIDKLSAFFTQKQYFWNDGKDVELNNGSLYLTENASGTTSNKFNGASQCHGFAELFISLVTGVSLSVSTNGADSLPSPWVIYNHPFANPGFGDFKIGDLIRMDEYDTTVTVGGVAKDKHYNIHSAIITNIDNENVTVIQTLYNTCQVNLGIFNDISSVPDPSKNPSMTKSFLREHCKYVVRYNPNLISDISMDPIYLKDTNSEDIMTIFELLGTRYFSLPSIEELRALNIIDEDTFDGWRTCNDDEGEIKENGCPIKDTDFLTTSNRSLYAKLTKSESDSNDNNMVQVTMYENFGDNEWTRVEMISGEAIGVLPEFSAGTRAGYRHTGWATDENGANKIDEDYIIPNCDVELFACWEKIIVKITLYSNFDDNVVINTIYKDACEAIGTVELLTDDTRQHYNNIGWALDRAGTTMITSTYIVPEEDFSLYACWEPKTYTLTFRSAENGDIDKEIEEKYNNSIDIPSPTDTLFELNESKYFKGWKDVTGNYLYPGEEYTVSGNAEFYGNWEEKRIVITFDGLGLVDVSPFEITYSDAVEYYGEAKIPCSILPLGALYCSVDGWITDDGSGMVYSGSDLGYLPEFKNYKMTAVNPRQMMSTITYDLSTASECGNSDVLLTQDKPYAGSAILQRECPVKSQGHNFKGWYDVDGNRYPPQAMINVRGNMTLYPEWIGGCYVIRYDTGVDNDDPYPAYDPPYAQDYPVLRNEDGSLKCDCGITISTVIPERPGYEFTGWRYTDINGEVKTITAGGELVLCDAYENIDFSQENTIVLTACWERIYKTVKFYDPYSGSHPISTITVGLLGKYGEQYDCDGNMSLFDFPVIEDRNFTCVMGWQLNGTEITAETTVTERDSYEVYPIYAEEVPYADLEGVSWAHTAIAKCKYYGYMDGVSLATFCPHNGVKRGEAITVINCMDGFGEVGNSKFYDVLETSSYCSAITWGNDKAIVNGVTEVLFKPENKITRLQMILLLYRYANYKGWNTYAPEEYDNANEEIQALWVDGKALSEQEAFLAMCWAVNRGLLTAFTSGSYMLDSVISRAQLAVIVIRFRNLYI